MKRAAAAVADIVRRLPVFLPPYSPYQAQALPQDFMAERVLARGPRRGMRPTTDQLHFGARLRLGLRCAAVANMEVKDESDPGSRIRRS